MSITKGTDVFFVEMISTAFGTKGVKINKGIVHKVDERGEYYQIIYKQEFYVFHKNSLYLTADKAIEMAEYMLEELNNK